MSTQSNGRYDNVGTRDLAERVALARRARLSGMAEWVTQGQREILVEQAAQWLADIEAAGLAVVELPEPDRWIDCEDDDGRDATTPSWETPGGEVLTAFVNGVETDERGLAENLNELRIPALKTLAAVAACERYQAKRQSGEPR